MAIEKINPPGLNQPVGYSQVTIASGTKRVYVSGQTGVGPDGVVVGPDLASQTAQALRKVTTALEAGGATWSNVVKMTILIVDYDPSMGAELSAGMSAVFGEDPPAPAATLHGVQSLFDPTMLVEIEVTAEI